MSELNLSPTTNHTDKTNLFKFNLNTDSLVSYVNKLKEKNGLNARLETESVNLLECKYESLIEKINRKTANNEYWFSLEFFPPKTINGAANLIQK